jgi:hypothetical protein
MSILLERDHSATHNSTEFTTATTSTIENNFLLESVLHLYRDPGYVYWGPRTAAEEIAQIERAEIQRVERLERERLEQELVERLRLERLERLERERIELLSCIASESTPSRYESTFFIEE